MLWCDLLVWQFDAECGIDVVLYKRQSFSALEMKSHRFINVRFAGDADHAICNIQGMFSSLGCMTYTVCVAGVTFGIECCIGID